MCPITTNSVAHMTATCLLRGLAVAAFAVAAVVAGCSSNEKSTPSSTSPSSSSSVSAAPTPGAVGISPGGVTTSMSAPAGSTEEEYYQACHWAREWMKTQPGDPLTQVEPYLAMVQASANGEKGTWNTPWSKLSAERQSGVIVAAQAAAEGGCD
jgi:hypothetical protein